MTARLAAVLFCFAAALVQAQETATWTTGTYQYDGSGNIKSIDGRPLTYDELGRLTKGKVDSIHGETYTYDDFGNMLTIQKDGQTVVTLGAKQDTNRISDPTANAFATYNPDGSIASTVNGDTFTYDGLGMVKESKVAGTRRLYLYSASEERIATVQILNNNAAGNREWTIRNPSGAALTRFTQTPSGAWSWDQDYVYANGQLLAAKVSGPEKVRHYYPDHLGTPRVITGNGGAELSRHTYYPFGEEVTATASTERLKFTGHERDDPTLDYMHARYYAPMWGRFLSVDPVINFDRAMQRPQGWNRYAYVTNNPTAKLDPDGKDEFIALGAVSEHPHMAEVMRRGSQGDTLSFTIAYHVARFKDKPFEVMADVLSLGFLLGEGLAARALPVMVEAELRGASTQARYVSFPSYYRGGNSVVAGTRDVKIVEGLVQPTRGVSVNAVASETSQFGGAYRITGMPDELMIVQRGRNPNHFEIVPREAMTMEKYQNLLGEVTLEAVKN